jgi:enoyl-CoA hydratase/carnithine racemase
MLNRCTLAFAASAISLVTVAPAAHADPAGPDVVPVAVLAVKSDEALDQAEAFTAALRTAVTNSKGWSLGQADQSLEFLAGQLSLNVLTDDTAEGVTAFLEKRPAKWADR